MNKMEYGLTEEEQMLDDVQRKKEFLTEIIEIRKAIESSQNLSMTEKPHSVEISVNAKGQYSGKVKVYAETIEMAMELSLAKAKELGLIIEETNAWKR